MSSLKYWIWLSSIGGIGPVTAALLLERFGTPENIFHAGEREYRESGVVRAADIPKLSDKNVGDANRILASCAGRGYRILTLQDADYPDRLRNIYDPPIVLYVRGRLPLIDEEAVVGVVGTRDCTPYGISAAENIGYKLSRHGLIVATGLARGVDSAVTRGALRGGGRVVGVIGSGLDVTYPAGNEALFEDVAASGAIVSEYPPGTPALKSHFPARNRIVSGISLGVAVVEAPKRSGALITASRALEQGRDVFALPGNIDARSCEGSNALLREGAIPILSADDIIGEYAELFPEKISKDIEAPVTSDAVKSGGHASGAGAVREGKRNNTKKEIDNISPVDYIDLGKIRDELRGDERAVAEAIGTGAALIDEIIIGSGLPAQQVLTALTILEISGYASRSANGKWKLENGVP